MADVKEIGFQNQSGDVPVVTTAETVAVASAGTVIPSETATVVIFAWAQLTTGAGTTAVTPRIRRGATTAGALMQEANPVTIGAAAGSTEQFMLMVQDRDLVGRGSADYAFTLEQVGATGNGSMLQAGILVLVL